MIKFITDTQRGEPPLLVAIFSDKLLVKDLDGVAQFCVQTPTGGWTHLLLEKLAGDLYSDGNLQPIFAMGVDAYLGDVWVGSTEV